MPDGITPFEFHQAVGVADWRVTSWGPQACFRATSFEHASQLVPEIVAAGSRLAVTPDVDLRPEAIVVRVHYRGATSIPANAPLFAAAISEAAVRLTLIPAPELVSTIDIAVAQHSESDARAFWNAALGYENYWESDSIDVLRRGPQLSFQPLQQPGRGRTHIDVSVSADFVEQRVAAALEGGGRIADDSHAPGWWTLASPDNHGIDLATWNNDWK